ncbi:MAG TPA: PIN domain-containing protein [Candidatus Obscuribacter sp.]|nr:PIN domain-containing protein [Candidatus Obscuribacter sp.]HMY02174.1 PIN domain-containing protein [Candidatus Obscuribacter sp.]HMY52451.1 PIN domain-containing protein [Candidatus Obscuribacter sp.]HNB16259.1 PIN domain-containing protein [Candidatus Obscuribacter sp.]HND65291.1 PIN domain-containing protein [Candidatus Obscuribacter sp.]
MSTKVLEAFTAATESMTTVIYVPTPVIWELAMLVENNDITISEPFSDWVEGLFEHRAIVPASFEVDTVKHYYGLNYHNDPFDRAIVATALQLDLPLISNDAKMHEHKPCKLFWD